MKYVESILDLINNTPLIHLNRIEKKYNLKSRIFAKFERVNPSGSIKDRIAKEMLLSALDSGKINKNTTIVDPTSGNTGIGLAMVAAALNLKTVIFMPSNCSIERVKMMKAFGADIRLTEGSKGMAGAISEANKFLSENKNSYMPEQFDNINNLLAHYKHTGPEIYDQLDGKVDIFTAGFGTGGTLTGVAKFLKEKNKDIYIEGVEPASSPFIEENRKGPHKIQGIGAGFKPSILNLDYVDKVVSITDDEAYEFARELAKKEGIFAGISSGANLANAVKLAKKFENKNIVTVLPDNGERYLSVVGLYD